MSVVKVTLGIETRRLCFSRAPSYEMLSHMVHNLFGLRAAKLLYTDDEGDSITLSSDAELQEAWRLLPPGAAALRLMAVDLSGSSTPAVGTPEPLAPPTDGQFAEPEQLEPIAVVAAADELVPNEEDSSIVKQVLAQLDAALNEVQRSLNESNVRHKFEAVIATCDRELTHASRAVQEQLEHVKSFVQAQTSGGVLEQQLQRLRTEINRFTAQLQAKLLAPRPPARTAPVQTEASAMIEQFHQVEDNSSVAQLVDEDLAQLEQMGFADTSRNVAMLLKHKGDVVAAVDELLQS